MSEQLMSLPSGLRPVRAPGVDSLRPDTVRVYADRPADIPAMLAAFERSLNSADRDYPALVVGTSGSTGTPKQTLLSAGALAASASATEGYFAGISGVSASVSGAAQWLLALPAHYVAGAQVLARSVLAGTSPVIADSVTQNVSFSPTVFLSAAHALSSSRTFISLVPTQLHKLLEAADSDPTLGSEIHAALGSFTGILLGGAPASAALLAQASELSLPVVTTYGSAESAGGCLYARYPNDLEALPGVQLRCVPEDSAPEGAGRIYLGGDHIASGYVGDEQRTAEHFFVDSQGTRWYRTDDYGALSTHGLSVLGRSDDVIISGGIKISASAVRQALEGAPQVREAFVAGVPDARWGSAVVAAYTKVGASGASSTAEPLEQHLSQLCTEQLGAHARPKLLVALEDFPVTSTGKPDRAALIGILTERYRAQ
ncbi:MAG: AMP-binding protein [Rothia sp. (in: high G+C Gram-positive bacteria)]|uniref:AMP-binding protein n=1 Tax=Rothia sp. (in: high G+C Gram-positive bacteria) TaxID=1885016 RepID=UPI0026DF134F|nr:AMP-binding protein [Rothia sp. (in: high G+C Gram-positive bacteria)]MDO5751150.1 AMP-binding protein [Rothia sp. (in: high G+C Gram-positive bacteria)]